MYTSLILLSSLLANVRAQTDYSQYVLPFLGADGGGNMFPGPVRPFGVVKLGPDVGNSVSGYRSTGNVVGFSMMHESGTGGTPKYGVVSQLPVVGNVSNPLMDLSIARASPDQAQVGYFNSSLSSGVLVELAATEHAAMYQYTFPSNGSANVVVDLSHVLSAGVVLAQNYVAGNVTIFPDGHYEGSATYGHGWNEAGNWTIFFCGNFDTAASGVQTFSGVNNKLNSYGTVNSTSGSDRQGAVFTFPGPQVRSRVGISWISSAKACQFVSDEIPPNADLQTVVNATKALWNTQVLSKITTTDTNATNLQLLYSSLYGMHMLPSNRTGENPNWTSSEPYYDDLYTLWDLFRTHSPLMQVLQPVAYEEQIRSMIDIWRHEGWLPDGRSSNSNGRTEGGSNADSVLADAYAKGVRGAVNWTDGYQAMVKDAEVVPPNNNDPFAPDGSTKEGRGALPDWKQYGYITSRFSRAVSRAIEYSANDFGLSQVAAGLGNTKDANKYLNSSRNWRNHWNPDVSSFGFKGFISPLLPSGRFESGFDPAQCNLHGSCGWKGPFFEALPWEYQFTTFHDMSTLVKLCGGAATFVQKLGTLFVPGLNPRGDSTFGKTLSNPGNEPGFANSYLFHFAGRQDISANQSRYIAKSFYDTSTSGLPGNSDAGAMQSWFLWNIIGLYPLTGQTTFLIGSPWFANMTIDLGSNKFLTVTTTGGSDTAFYVQSLTVNGQAWNKSWVEWSDVFANGGSMAYVLGSTPQNWTTGPLPPSPASGSSADLDLVQQRQKQDARSHAVEFALVATLCSVTLAMAVVAAVFLCVRARKRTRLDQENTPKPELDAVGPVVSTAAIREEPVVKDEADNGAEDKPATPDLEIRQV